MSRIGKQPVIIPAGVKVSVSGDVLKIEGKAGKIDHPMVNHFDYKIEGNAVKITPKEGVSLKDKLIKAKYGTDRAILNNEMKGAVEGFTKVLVLVGVGYRAQLQGKKLNFTLGFSHPVSYELPEGIKADVKDQTRITITGINKQLVGQVAATIKKIKPPEPYQGKGVMYEGERIRRKAGKSAAGAKK